MNPWSSALISSLLLLCAVGLMAMHVRTWRLARAGKPDAEELDYRYRQFRRRMQSSALLGLMAVAIFAGQWIPVAEVLLTCLFWGGVLLGLCWVGLLALADIWATKHYFGRLRQTYIIEQAKLHAQARRLQAARGNGKAAGKSAPPPADPGQ